MQSFDIVERFAVILLVAGMGMFIWGWSIEPPTSLIAAISGAYSDWSPGLVVDGLLLLVINRVLRNNERSRILGQVGSLSNEFALDAVRRCQEEGWQKSGAMAGRCYVKARLSRADLSGAHLSGSDFSFADLRDVDFMHANLKGADFTGANLKGADLRWADLTDATLRWADLTGAEIDGARLQGVDATSACIEQHHRDFPELNAAIVGGYLCARQLELLKENFELLLAEGPPVIRGFYERLFVAAPEVKGLFSSDMDRQARKFLQSLQVIVSSLACTEKAVPMLQRLGERHRDYGVEPDHYPVVGGVLIETLEHALADAFTGEARDAWAGAFAQIAAIMSAAPEVVATGSVQTADQPNAPEENRIVRFPRQATNDAA